MQKVPTDTNILSVFTADFEKNSYYFSASFFASEFVRKLPINE